jgi:hypothetical protein
MDMKKAQEQILAKSRGPNAGQLWLEAHGLLYPTSVGCTQPT